MNTQTRLIVLLGLLLAGFGAAIFMMRGAHSREADRMWGDLKKEQGVLLDSLVELTGESLQNFAGDYSFWDELVEFVRTGDPTWAKENIEVSLATFHAHGAWVLRLDNSQVYGAVRAIEPSLVALPVPRELLAEKLRSTPFAHFYARTAAGLLEFRTAPIQPTADADRVSPALGWFVVARLWSAEQLEPLQRVLASEISLTEVGQPSDLAVEANRILLQRDLLDLRGDVAMVLQVRYRSTPLALLLRHHQSDMVIFASFGAVMLLGIVIGVGQWVIRPLRRLEQSLAANSPAPLTPLLHAPDEFGRLAKLVGNSFAQRRQLELEVDERRRVELALRQSQEELRGVSNLKSRLARDLHDGVIQSIYAAGLGLEGLRTALRNDPALGERRLDAAQSSLNQTIREVRNFIQGLDPEETERTDFGKTVRALVSTMQTLYPADLQLQIDPALHGLTAREEVHALQILRECVSNAHRHGGASQIQIHFQATPTAATLEIADNGCGFDPAAVRNLGGSGLVNLATRAAEIGAQLEILSAPGKGTRISLRFAQRSGPA
ncbi:MAG: CHASE4 domain-containing protein [Candidatus Didemnitutus sp.]|nr:CHASE4 domain-containing protein [Candidatus Didemnitutus sp.]